MCVAVVAQFLAGRASAASAAEPTDDLVARLAVEGMTVDERSIVMVDLTRRVEGARGETTFIVAAAVPVIVGFLAIAVARYLYSTELANPDMTIFFMWLGGTAPAWRRLTRSPARRRARGRRAPAPHPGTSCGRPYCPS